MTKFKYRCDSKIMKSTKSLSGHNLENMVWALQHHPSRLPYVTFIRENTISDGTPVLSKFHSLVERMTIRRAWIRINDLLQFGIMQIQKDKKLSYHGSKRKIFKQIPLLKVKPQTTNHQLLEACCWTGLPWFFSLCEKL